MAERYKNKAYSDATPAKQSPMMNSRFNVVDTISTYSGSDSEMIGLSRPGLLNVSSQMKLYFV